MQKEHWTKFKIFPWQNDQKTRNKSEFPQQENRLYKLPQLVSRSIEKRQNIPVGGENEIKNKNPKFTATV